MRGLNHLVGSFVIALLALAVTLGAIVGAVGESGTLIILVIGLICAVPRRCSNCRRFHAWTATYRWEGGERTLHMCRHCNGIIRRGHSPTLLEDLSDWRDSLRGWRDRVAVLASTTAEPVRRPPDAIARRPENGSTDRQGPPKNQAGTSSIEPVTELGPIKKAPRSGQEPFRASGESIDGADVLDFWRWSFSDLVSNATRGVLAEYLVGKALSCREQVRVQWAPYDLTTPNGITIEVKSAAYIQSWQQDRFSQIGFDVRPTTAWSEKDASYDTDPKRQADVYVFALLTHQDQKTLDPLNLDQWTFYVLPTAALNESVPGQKRLSLTTLIDQQPEEATYSSLAPAVQRAAGHGKQ